MRNETPQSAAALVGRLLLAALFLLEGWSKLRGYGPAAAYMERFSVPGLLLPAVILAELSGGILLVIGWQTRCAALALAIFCVVAALLFHKPTSPTATSSSTSRRTWPSPAACWCSQPSAPDGSRWTAAGRVEGTSAKRTAREMAGRRHLL